MTPGPAYNVHNVQRGISLVFVLTLVSSTLVVVLSLSYILRSVSENYHRQVGAVRLEYITNKIFTILQNDQAWERTRSLNSSMYCLASNTCPDVLNEFDLYYSSGEAVLRSAGDGEGFTLSGDKCSDLGFSFDVNSRNFNCPFAIKLFWRPSLDPIHPERIRIEAKILTNMIINTAKFEDILAFTRGEYLSTLDANCAKLGGTLNQVTSICEFPFQSRSCLRGQKMIGVDAGTGLLECMDLPAVSLISCPGGSAGMMPDGRFICL